MQILYLCTDPGIPFWGTKGASIHVREFTRALLNAGHAVTVVMARRGKAPGGATHSLPLVEIPAVDGAFFQPPASASAGSAEAALLYEARQFAQNRAVQDVLSDLLASQTFDVICERYSLFGTGGREAARRGGIPFVLEVNAPLIDEARTHRQLVLEPLAQAVATHLFSTADCVFPVSAPLGQYIHGMVPDANVTVMPNGVDLRRFATSLDGQSWRSRWGDESGDNFFIGFVGSLKPWHGIDILLESFLAVHRTNKSARLVFVGEGPERETIEKAIGANGLGDRVIMTGAVAHDQVPHVMRAMDVLVAPYPALERFYFSPLKVYEYMAAGRPIVASRIGQIDDILAEDDTALLLPPGDPEALADALLKLYHNPSQRERLGQKAREVAVTDHGWDRRAVDWTRLAKAAARPAAKTGVNR